MKDIICYNMNGEVINYFTQWDRKQKIVIRSADVPYVTEFHFCNSYSDTAKIVIGNDQDDMIIVEVPDILLQQASPLVIHLYGYGEDGLARTYHTVRVPVHPRPKPDNYQTSGDSSNLRVLESVFTLDSAGSSIVDIGFRPDSVVIYGDSYNSLGSRVGCDLQAVFSYGSATKIKQISTQNVASNNDGYSLMNAIVEQSESGFIVRRLWYSNQSGGEHVNFGKIYNYVALKFT